MKACPGCRNQLPDTFVACPTCGMSLANVQPFYPGVSQPSKEFTGKESTKLILTVVLVVVVVIVILTVAVIAWFYWFVATNPFSGNPTSTPSGTFKSADNTGLTTEKLVFGTFTPTTLWSLCKLKVNDGNDSYSFSMAGSYYSVNCTTSGNPDFWVTATDINMDNKISNGDFIVIRMNGAGFLSGDHFTVSIIYLTTDKVINEISFTR